MVQQCLFEAELAKLNATGTGDSSEAVAHGADKTSYRHALLFEELVYPPVREHAVPFWCLLFVLTYVLL
jgi:hypothetical protein